MSEPESAPLLPAFFNFVTKIAAGLRSGAIQGAGIAIVLGTVGIIAEAITATGAAVPLGWAVEALSRDSLFLALLSTAAICIVIGAGVPTVGAYILTAAVAGPILIAQGLDVYSANFFILYFACLSAVSPPVAAAALAASAIAGSNYLRTALEATRLSVMLYLLPFLFVYQPALLGRDVPPIMEMGLILFELALASALAAAAAQGFLLSRLDWVARLTAVCAVAGFAVHISVDGALWLAVGITSTTVLAWLQLWPRLSRASG